MLTHAIVSIKDEGVSVHVHHLQILFAPILASFWLKTSL